MTVRSGRWKVGTVLLALIAASCLKSPLVPTEETSENPFEDTQPPYVMMVSPRTGDVVSGSVTLIADAVDNVAVDHVEFFIDEATAPEGSDDTYPYEVSWDTTVLPDSSVHTIYARAFDTSLNYSHSETIQVMVENTNPPPVDSEPPTVSISYPQDGATVSGTITITAAASDNVSVLQVEFFIDGIMPPDGIEYNPPYEQVWDTSSLPDGSVHAIVAKATDTSGNSSFSDTISVTVENGSGDTTPPVVSITTPTDGALVWGYVHIVADATDNVAVDHVDFFIDGVKPQGATEYNPPYEHYWDTSALSDGSTHTIEARATDAAGNVGVSAVVTVTVQSGGGGGGGGSVVLNEDFTGRQIFPADNWWNLDVTNAPVDPNSSAFISWIGAGTSLHPDFGPPPYGIPYVGVPGDQPLKIVYFYSYGDESDAGAPGRPPGYPIPDEAYLEPNYIEGGVPGGGNSGDRHLLLIDRDNWLLFELFGTHWDSSLQRWEAASGAIFNLATNDRRPEGWTSTDAAGLAVFPGLIRYDEVFGAGEIDHAFRFTTRATNGYVWPASHAAGSNPSAPPLGARLRMKASVDISGYPQPIQKIFRAMKKYGLILADNGTDMFVQGTMDGRWDSGMLNGAFHSLSASDFEVLQLGWDPVNNP